jgi:hypothetical protein
VGSWGGPGRDVFVQALHGAAQSLTPVAGSCWFESSPRPPFLPPLVPSSIPTTSTVLFFSLLRDAGYWVPARSPCDPTGHNCARFAVGKSLKHSHQQQLQAQAVAHSTFSLHLSFGNIRVCTVAAADFELLPFIFSFAHPVKLASACQTLAY